MTKVSSKYKIIILLCIKIIDNKTKIKKSNKRFSLLTKNLIKNKMDICFINQSIYDNLITNPAHYKIIILIIASPNETNNYFIKCWESYMNQFHTVKSYFIYADPNINQDIIVDENKLICKTTETYIPGIFEKTTIAMRFCKEFLSYDYILRTNISSFFHIPRILNYLEEQPKTKYVASPFGYLPNDEHNIKKPQQTLVNNYLNLELNDKFIFLHGSFFLFSQDIVDKYLKNINQLYNKPEFQKIQQLPDDIVISLVLYNFLTLPKYEPNSLYYPIEFININQTKYNCKELEEPNQYDKEFFFTIRNRIYENKEPILENRYKDIINYIKQVQYHYNKPHFMENTITQLLEDYNK